MTKGFQFILFISIFYASSIFANPSDAFSFDDFKIRNELNSLNLLEEFLETNTSTYQDLLADKNAIVVGLNYNSLYGLSSQMYEPPLGIPSVFWGACGSFWGILLVYLITEDKEETKKAAYGFIGATAVGIGCYVVFVVFLVGSQFAFIGMM